MNPPELRKRDDPVFREGLREDPLHPLVVLRVQRFGRPVPLDEPEGTHERADVGALRGAREGQGDEEEESMDERAPRGGSWFDRVDLHARRELVHVVSS